MSGNKIAKNSRIVILITLILFVSVMVVSAHWPALSAQALAFDDVEYLINNPLVKNPGWSSAGRFLTEVLRPSTVAGYYQPLSMISLMLDYGMGGRVDNFRVFHQTSLALHVINTVMIIVLLYLLFGKPWVAAMAGLLFGVHPLTVEPIPWVGERKTLLAAFFVLLSLITYVLYTRKSGKKYLWASLAMYVLALMSKPTSTPLPVLMLLLDYWPVKRSKWQVVWEKAPFFVIGFVSAVITYLSQKYTASVITPEKYSPMRILLVLCHNVVFYLYKFLWPVKLSSYYPFPEPMTLSHPMILAGVAGTCLLIPALLISLRRTRALLTGWLFFFIAIFPTMGVIGFTNVIASDKYAYLPLVGFLLILAWLLAHFQEKVSRMHRRVFIQVGLVVFVLAISISELAATRNYLVHWQDSEVYYRHMISLTPEASSLHVSLGMILSDRGKTDQAISQFEEAIRLNPNDAFAYCNYALALEGQEKLDEVIMMYRKALEIRPSYAEVHYRLGYIFSRQKKYDEAINNYKMAIKYKPDYAEAYNSIGVALYNQGKPDEAIPYYREAIQLNSGYIEAHNNIGAALAVKGNLDEAISHFKKVISLKPDLIGPYINIAIALYEQGKLDEAIGIYRKALKIKPLDAEIHAGLGELLVESGKTDEAVMEYREALRINPDLTDIKSSLEDLMKMQNNGGTR